MNPATTTESRAYLRVGDYSNRFTIYAFVSRQTRDEYAAKINDNLDSSKAWAVTRREARRMLGDKYLSPGVDDCRTSAGCYLGSRDDWKDDYRREQALPLYSCFGMPVPDGLVSDPIRL